MLLTPLPGGRDNLLKNLEKIRLALSNARTSRTKIVDKHMVYLDAVSEGARLLRGQVRPRDIDELLFTRRYWSLVDMATTPDPAPAVVSDFLALEIDDRLLEVDATIASTRDALNRWTDTAGQLVLPDTSFYLRNARVLKNINFRDILHTDDTITLLFPLVVIEELDRAKRRRDDGRHKAQVALALLEAHAKDGLSGKWKDAPTVSGQAGRGGIWFDVVLDPPGHVQLGNPDAEIIDRALGVEALAGREVTFLTNDTNQVFRARGAGLNDVRKLDDHEDQNTD